MIIFSVSKATRAGSSTKPNACSPSRPFPPEASASWEKEHDRLERRRLIRVAVTPGSIGLVGCWQVLAVRRETIHLNKPKEPATDTIGYYAASLCFDQYDEKGLLKIVRDHWSAIENETHYRRDVTFREDACRTTHRVGAEVLASFRNLANGLYELERARERTQVDTLASWCQRQTFTTARSGLRG